MNTKNVLAITPVHRPTSLPWRSNQADSTDQVWSLTPTEVNNSSQPTEFAGNLMTRSHPATANATMAGHRSRSDADARNDSAAGSASTADANMTTAVVAATACA